ncbi:hypothetical protein V8F20_011146 [Naviculisporaceae sp. PSN 640]
MLLSHLQSVVGIAAAFVLVTSGVHAAPAEVPAEAVPVVDKNATAAPIAGPTPVLSKREDVWILGCEHIRWGAPCVYISSPAGACKDLPPEWNDKFSSVQRNSPSGTCTWYEHPNCGGQGYGNQNDANLADGNGWWNDRISSFRCNLSAPPA